MDPQHRDRSRGEPLHRGSRLRPAHPEVRKALTLAAGSFERPGTGRGIAAFALLFALFHLPEVVQRLTGGGHAEFLLLAFFPAAWWLGQRWHPAGFVRAYALEGGSNAVRWVAGLFVLAVVAKGGALAIGAGLRIYDSGIPNGYGDAPALLVAIAVAVQFTMLATFTFVPSLAEDVLTRGWLLRWPRVRWNGPAFVAASTVLYVLNHVWRLGEGPYEWAMLAAFGIAYGTALWRRGTLWAAVGLHWGWNFAGSAFAALPPGLEVVDANGARLLSAGAHLVSAGILLVLPQRAPHPEMPFDDAAPARALQR